MTSTDVGDPTHLMPVLNFTFEALKAPLHSKDFRLTDAEKAFVSGKADGAHCLSSSDQSGGRSQGNS